MRGLLVEKDLEVLAAERAQQSLVGADDRVGEVALGRLQLDDLVFHRVGGEQAIGEDVPRLADAVRAIDRLRFHGRVPPRIEQKDVVRVRFSPRPPAFRLIRNSRLSGSS